MIRNRRALGVSRLVAAVTLCISLFGAACVGPALTGPMYQDKAVASLERLHATIAGTRIALDAALAGRSYAPVTAVTVRQHEKTVSWIHTAFATRQPPPGTDAIRRAVIPVLSDAASLFADVRIAANRADEASLRQQRSRLDELSERIDRALREVRS